LTREFNFSYNACDFKVCTAAMLKLCNQSARSVKTQQRIQ